LRQFFVPMAFTALFLNACSAKPVEGVTDAMVKLPAVAGNPGAAYFTLNGGAADNRLMEVTSPHVVRIELHDNMMAGGMMKMTPIETGVAVPAGGKVAFKPGGEHAMLYDINPKIMAGAKMKLIFSYANGRKVEVDADVKAAGDTAEHSH
jgi:periplasmic copper chaperone A